MVLDGQIVAIRGDCGVEEAETLMGLLQANPDFPVDISGSGSIHTALWQVAMVLRPRLIGEPSDPFIRQRIMPLVTERVPATRGLNLPLT
ncbi:hypothetical protein SAMN02745157_4463 [Kaistia soli DSM 19436]|uniref:Uncharacterized protein n=1 Tax=Kaistia soli DSM 19436 TaxID=1122133 RepID=A0A1M5L1J1_9HYPH|nr:hypothetical protein SAMN02745157_4463 [Kaistia soli DSM 19436]